MRRHLLLLPLTALATLNATSAAASEWHAVEPDSQAAKVASRAAGNAREVAETYLKHASRELGLVGVDLMVRNELSVGTHRTVRFAQSYAGLPVLGGAAAVHVASDGRVKASVLDVARGLSVSSVPSLSDDSARKAIETSLGMSLAERPEAALAVIADQDGPGKLVWAVDVRTGRGGDRYLVDAHAGGIVHRRALAVDALGRVYPISAVVTPAPRDLELADLDEASPQKLNGWEGNLSVTNYVSGGQMGGQALTLAQDLVPNSGEDFLYDPPADASDPSDAFAQVGIYYHLTRMRDYFTSKLGLDMSSRSWKLVAVANMQDSGRPLDNAYFSPQGVGAPWSAPNLIAIGQGSQFDFSDDSDVFLHEFTHYVNGNAIGFNEGQLATSEFGLSPWGGSIDEGAADYFACTVNGEPKLGEASLELMGAARDLSDDSKKCPDDLIGEVHEDGELIGSVAWAMREAFGQERGDRLVWGALTLLTKTSSFGDFARGLLMITHSMVDEGTLEASDVATVEALLKSRGLDDCDEVLETGGGKTRKTTMFGISVLARAFGGSCAQVRSQFNLQSLFHFKSTPAPDARGVRFTVDLQAFGGGDDLEWSIYVRKGEHVGFDAGGFIPLPTVSDFDYSVEKITETHGEIVIDEKSNPPFDPTQTYYMVIGHGNCPNTIATVSSSDLALDPEPTMPTEPDPAPKPDVPNDATPDGEDPAATDTPAGCACRTAEPNAKGAPWAALAGVALAAAAALRRRDRRS